MICPQCGSEYREGFTRCSDCEVYLVPELPPTGEMPDAVLVRIAEATDAAQISVFKSIFKDAEIEFVTRNEALQDLIGGGRMAGFNPILGPVEFWVREEDEAVARELVRQTETSSVSSPEPLEEEDRPAPSSRPWRRIIAAGVLNIILLPLSTFTAYALLRSTTWGQRHSASVPSTAQAIAIVVFAGLCLLWILRPRIAVWLQLALAVPMLWTFAVQDSPRPRSASLAAKFEEHGLFVFATVMALAGVALIAVALVRMIRRAPHT